jgi:hypothetical protein
MEDLYAQRIWLLTVLLAVALSFAFGFVQGRF